MIGYQACYDGSDFSEMSFRVDSDAIAIIHYGEVLCELPIIRYFYADEQECLFIDTALPDKEVKF